MRRAFQLGLLFLLGACALFEPGGQRFVVFFQPGQHDLEPAAEQVVTVASSYAIQHADMRVIVAGFADPNGATDANASLSSQRAQNVVKGLLLRGVPSGSIERRSFGAVPYTFDSQEGRRVEITIGTL